MKIQQIEMERVVEAGHSMKEVTVQAAHNFDETCVILDRLLGCSKHTHYSSRMQVLVSIKLTTGVYPPYPGGNSSATPNLQVNLQLQQLVTAPALLGKGL